MSEISEHAMRAARLVVPQYVSLSGDSAADEQRVRSYLRICVEGPTLEAARVIQDAIDKAMGIVPQTRDREKTDG